MPLHLIIKNDRNNFPLCDLRGGFARDNEAFGFGLKGQGLGKGISRVGIASRER